MNNFTAKQLLRSLKLQLLLMQPIALLGLLLGYYNFPDNRTVFVLIGTAMLISGIGFGVSMRRTTTLEVLGALKGVEPNQPASGKTRSGAAGRKIYVGNLAYNVKESDLQELFSAHGTVNTAQVIIDRSTGRSQGFGFVEMSNDQEVLAAISALNGKEVEGRNLIVNEARPREEGGGASYGGGGAGAG